MIAFRIVLLFSIAMAYSFLPEKLQWFFGDKGNDWGVRHYWFNWMTVFLFLLSAIDFICHVIKIITKNYNTEDWGA